MAGEEALLEGAEGQPRETGVDLEAAYTLACRVIQGLEDASPRTLPRQQSRAPLRPLQALALSPVLLPSERQFDDAATPTASQTAHPPELPETCSRHLLNDAERAEASMLVQQVLRGLAPEMAPPVPLPRRAAAGPAADDAPASSSGLPSPDENLPPSPPVHDWIAAKMTAAEMTAEIEQSSPNPSSPDPFLSPELFSPASSCGGLETSALAQSTSAPKDPLPVAQFCRLSLQGDGDGDGDGDEASASQTSAFICWARRREADRGAADTPRLPRGGLVHSVDSDAAVMALLYMIRDEILGADSGGARSSEGEDGALAAGSLLLCSAGSVGALETKLRRLRVPYASHTTRRRLWTRVETMRQPVVVGTYGLLSARDVTIPEVTSDERGNGWRIKRSASDLADRQRGSLLHTVRWRRIVLLDAEQVRNRTCQRAQAAARLRSGVRWLVPSDAAAAGREQREQKLQGLCTAVLSDGSPRVDKECKRHWSRLVYNMSESVSAGVSERTSQRQDSPALSLLAESPVGASGRISDGSVDGTPTEDDDAGPDRWHRPLVITKF